MEFPSHFSQFFNLAGPHFTFTHVGGEMNYLLTREIQQAWKDKSLIMPY